MNAEAWARQGVRELAPLDGPFTTAWRLSVLSNLFALALKEERERCRRAAQAVQIITENQDLLAMGTATRDMIVEQIGRLT